MYHGIYFLQCFSLQARQIFLENLYVMIAMVLIVVMAVVTVILKAVLFPDEEVITFVPLKQQVPSVQQVQYTVQCSLYRRYSRYCSRLSYSSRLRVQYTINYTGNSTS